MNPTQYVRGKWPTAMNLYKNMNLLCQKRDYAQINF